MSDLGANKAKAQATPRRKTKLAPVSARLKIYNIAKIKEGIDLNFGVHSIPSFVD